MGQPQKLRLLHMKRLKDEHTVPKQNMPYTMILLYKALQDEMRLPCIMRLPFTMEKKLPSKVEGAAYV